MSELRDKGMKIRALETLLTYSAVWVMEGVLCALPSKFLFKSNLSVVSNI